MPLYDNSPVDPTKKVNEPNQIIRMDEYIKILQSGPSDLRIFLYNILKNVPELQKDFIYPDLGVKMLKNLPLLFFGGTGANVFMHYDVDYSNLFHFHFAGTKRCVIVPPDQTKHMYKLPYSWIQHEDINFANPDFDRWPELRNVKPLVTELKHGEMLYMPEGYWHFMQYLSPGFALTLRSLAHKPANLAQGINNLVFIRTIDNIMRKWKGKKWIDYKNELCEKGKI